MPAAAVAAARGLVLEGAAFLVDRAGDRAVGRAARRPRSARAVVERALRLALPLTLALQWALRSRYSRPPVGAAGLRAAAARVALGAAAIVVLPALALGESGALAGLLTLTWTAGTILIRRGWTPSTALLVLAADAGDAAAAPVPVLAAAAASRRSRSRWRCGPARRAIRPRPGAGARRRRRADRRRGRAAARRRPERELDGRGRRRAGAAAVGDRALWAGHRLWKLGTFPHALAGVAVGVAGARAARRWPGSSGSIARLVLLTAVLSAALLPWLYPAPRRRARGLRARRAGHAAREPAGGARARAQCGASPACSRALAVVVVAARRWPPGRRVGRARAAPAGAGPARAAGAHAGDGAVDHVSRRWILVSAVILGTLARSRPVSPERRAACVGTLVPAYLRAGRVRGARRRRTPLIVNPASGPGERRTPPTAGRSSARRPAARACSATCPRPTPARPGGGRGRRRALPRVVRRRRHLPRRGHARRGRAAVLPSGLRDRHAAAGAQPRRRSPRAATSTSRTSSSPSRARTRPTRAPGERARVGARRARPRTSSTPPRASRRAPCSPPRPAAPRSTSRRACNPTPGATAAVPAGRKEHAMPVTRTIVLAAIALAGAPAAALAQAPPGPPGPPPGNGTDLPALARHRAGVRPARHGGGDPRGTSGPGLLDARRRRAQPRQAHVLGAARVPGQRHAPRPRGPARRHDLARARYRCAGGRATARLKLTSKVAERLTRRRTVAATATIRQGAARSASHFQLTRGPPPRQAEGLLDRRPPRVRAPASSSSPTSPPRRRSRSPPAAGSPGTRPRPAGTGSAARRERRALEHVDGDGLGRRSSSTRTAPPSRCRGRSGPIAVPPGAALHRRRLRDRLLGRRPAGPPVAVRQRGHDRRGRRRAARTTTACTHDERVPRHRRRGLHRLAPGRRAGRRAATDVTVLDDLSTGRWENLARRAQPRRAAARGRA